VIAIRLEDSIGPANNDPFGEYIDPPPFVELRVGSSFTLRHGHLLSQRGIEVARYEEGIGWRVTGYDNVTFHRVYGWEVTP
jgi:hypothetical protein